MGVEFTPRQIPMQRFTNVDVDRRAAVMRYRCHNYGNS